MKKIIHIVSSLKVGGAEKFVKNLSIEQLSQNIHSEIVSFGNKNDAFQHLLEQAGVNVINLNGGLFRRLAQLVQIFRGVGIIHIHSPAVIRAILPIFPMLFFKKVIYTIHGEVDPPQSLMKFSHQISWFYLNKVVAVSESAKQSVMRRYNWNSNNVDVIKNGVNVVSQFDKNKSNNKLHLGVVSRIIPLKNIPLLFDAIEQLPIALSSQVVVHVFGDGPSHQDIVDRAKNIPDMTEIEFYGNVVTENNIYPKFDVLVMCSNTEGLPMSILEAMGYGIPVVSTDVGAIPQVIEDQKTGWLYPIKTVDALVNILTEIILNPDLVSSYGEKAKRYIDNNYAIHMIAEDYQRIYKLK